MLENEQPKDLQECVVTCMFSSHEMLLGWFDCSEESIKNDTEDEHLWKKAVTKLLSLPPPPPVEGSLGQK